MCFYVIEHHFCGKADKAGDVCCHETWIRQPARPCPPEYREVKRLFPEMTCDGCRRVAAEAWEAVKKGEQAEKAAEMAEKAKNAA